jgi:ABC-type polysaccharide/polyol phosphate transport system ATPase subunit
MRRAIVGCGSRRPMLARLSTRAIWMEQGAVRADGPFEDVRLRYLEAVEAASS